MEAVLWRPTLTTEERDSGIAIIAATGVWALSGGLYGCTHLAAADLGEITRAVKRRLKGIQYRPDLVDGASPRPA
ncbi:hypothetical protein IQ62_04230 [Streptomyces scabiei]|nr:hypothetical protein IQ62_04230 [Streptomyces scabiei]